MSTPDRRGPGPPGHRSRTAAFQGARMPCNGKGRGCAAPADLRIGVPSRDPGDVACIRYCASPARPDWRGAAARCRYCDDACRARAYRDGRRADRGLALGLVQAEAEWNGHTGHVPQEPCSAPGPRTGPGSAPGLSCCPLIAGVWAGLPWHRDRGHGQDAHAPSNRDTQAPLPLAGRRISVLWPMIRDGECCRPPRRLRAQSPPPSDHLAAQIWMAARSVFWAIPIPTRSRSLR